MKIKKIDDGLNLKIFIEPDPEDPHTDLGIERKKLFYLHREPYKFVFFQNEYGQILFSRIILQENKEKGELVVDEKVFPLLFENEKHKQIFLVFLEHLNKEIGVLK